MKYYTEALYHPVFKIISESASALGVDSYVIGGFVRDYLLQRNIPKDIDVVAIGSGIDLAQRVASKLSGKPKVQVFKNFGTAMIKTADLEIEFVGARKESYDRSSRKPAIEDGTLEDDQLRRDFTVNAMAFSLNKRNFGELLDPFSGITDLKTKTLRTPADSDITFSDDPLRMMRAVRFASQLHFEINTEAFQAIKRNAERIRIVSKERIVDELNKKISWSLL